MAEAKRLNELAALCAFSYDTSRSDRRVRRTRGGLTSARPAQDVDDGDLFSVENGRRCCSCHSGLS